MCTIWNQDQWRKATKDEMPGYEGDYRLIGTYVNAEGKEALLITDATDGTVEYEAMPDIQVIYGDDSGEQPQFTNWSTSEEGYNEVVEEAKASLARRGYTEKTPEVRVQGLTLDQWSMVGGFNNLFGFHIHPELDLEHPENLSETEMQALSNSMTPKERMLMALKIIDDLREYTLTQLTILELEEYVSTLTPSLA